MKKNLNFVQIARREILEISKFHSMFNKGEIFFKKENEFYQVLTYKFLHDSDGVGGGTNYLNGFIYISYKYLDGKIRWKRARFRTIFTKEQLDAYNCFYSEIDGYFVKPAKTKNIKSGEMIAVKTIGKVRKGKFIEEITETVTKDGISKTNLRAIVLVLNDEGVAIRKNVAYSSISTEEEINAVLHLLKDNKSDALLDSEIEEIKLEDFDFKANKDFIESVVEKIKKSRKSKKAKKSSKGKKSAERTSTATLSKVPNKKSEVSKAKFATLLG
jgi:hypothetical protein